RTAEGAQGPLAALAFSPDHKHLAAAGKDAFLYVYDVTSGKLEFKSAARGAFTVHSVAYSPDGAWIVTGGDDRMVRVWRATAGAPAVRSIQAHLGNVYQVAFSPDGKMLATAGADHLVKIHDFNVTRPDLNGGEPRALQGHTKAVTCLAFSKDGK